MRVGVFRHTLFLPSETFIADQASAFTRVETVLISRDELPRQRIQSQPGLRVASLAEYGHLAKFRHMALMPGPLARVINDTQVDLLHAHFGVEGVFAMEAARRSSIPLVVTLHGFDVTRSPRALRWSRNYSWLAYERLRSRLFASPAHFICVSQHIRSRAISLGVAPERIEVIPTGSRISDAANRALSDREMRLVHVGRLVEKKGTRYLLEAFAKIAVKHPDVRLRVVGDGELRAELERRSDALGLGGRVVFLGALTHAETLGEIRDATIVVVPSVTASDGDSEGLPQVLLEAGAARKPIVATNHSGIPDMIVDQVNGVLVEERDTAALAQAIELLVDNAGLRARLGAEARKTVVQQFELGSQSAKVEEFYFRAMARAAGTGEG